MKTLKRNGEIVRTADNKVDELIARGYVYCPKSEWKTNVRDISIKSTKDESGETIKTETKKISKKK